MGTRERRGEGLLYVSSDDPSVSFQSLSSPSVPYPPGQSLGLPGQILAPWDVWTVAKAWEALGLPMGARVGVLT